MLTLLFQSQEVSPIDSDFPLSKFRLLYPQFASVSDEVVYAIAEQAECFMSIHACACSDQSWMLMVAHMLALRAASESGNSAPGMLTSATIGSVSVSFQAPTSSDGWSHWLNQSPFGQQFLALSKACFGGVRYVGSLPERAAFRSVGGLFPGRGRMR